LWPLADIPYVAFDVAFGGKADMAFWRKCPLLTQSGHRPCLHPDPFGLRVQIGTLP
jgi:hypothetical protein